MFTLLVTIESVAHIRALIALGGAVRWDIARKHDEHGFSGRARVCVHILAVTNDTTRQCSAVYLMVLEDIIYFFIYWKKKNYMQQWSVVLYLFDYGQSCSPEWVIHIVR